MGEDRTGRDLDRALTVADAARALGITQDAVRKRIRRRTIHSDKDESGRIYVYVPASETVHKTDQDASQPLSDSAALISQMQERIASLERQLDQEREANSEHRRLLLRALERIPPQLEARESPETVEEELDRAESRSATVESQEGVQRPWWRRVFGS